MDGFHPVNVGRLAQGRPALAPCTPVGVMRLLKETGASLDGARAVVVGRSNIVGKPVAQLLLAANATVTIAHSKTRDLAAICREADVLVAAVGRAGMVRGESIKDGAIVIDVGINRVDLGDGKTKLVGDVAFDEAKERASWITPVPAAWPMSNRVLAGEYADGGEGADVAGRGRRRGRGVARFTRLFTSESSLARVFRLRPCSHRSRPQRRPVAAVASLRSASLDRCCARALGGSRTEQTGRGGHMLEIYGVILDVVKELRPVIGRIERCDSDLGGR